MTLNMQCSEIASLRLYEAETSIELMAERYDLDPTKIVDFSLNVNPLGSPPSAIRAAKAALVHSNLYPDLRFAALRAALAKRHEVSEDHLFFGAGLDDVIKLILQAWTSEGDRILVHLPTFPRYELEARLRGCEVVAVENDSPEKINPDRIARALATGDIALAFLCTPNNPTGATVSNEVIAQLVVAHPDTLFVVDEALIFPGEEGAIPLCRDHANICVLRTFSKYFGLAGLRIGYAVADPSLIRIAEAGRPPFNMAAAAVNAAAAAVNDDAFLAECKAVFRDELDHFCTAIAAYPDLSVKGSNANMLLLDLGARSVDSVVVGLAQRGVVVADATSFRGLERHSMIRVSLRCRTENQRLITALEEVL